MARILIVEDEAHSARALEIFFSSLGHEVRTAERADTALALAHDFVPQVVLTDLLLIGPQDGVDVARELAGLEPAPRVILMSGLPRVEVEERAKGEPFFQIHTKPLKLALVRASVDEAIASLNGGGP